MNTKQTNQPDAPDCPKCGNKTKRATFRTGSIATPKREEDCCGSCGTHTPANTTPEPTEDA